MCNRLPVVLSIDNLRHEPKKAAAAFKLSSSALRTSKRQSNIMFFKHHFVGIIIFYQHPLNALKVEVIEPQPPHPKTKVNLLEARDASQTAHLDQPQECLRTSGIGGLDSVRNCNNPIDISKIESVQRTVA